MLLKERVAVITGGDSGIGFASARLFLKEGAKVVIMSNNADTLRLAREHLEAEVMTIETDVTEIDDLAIAFTDVGRRFGRIDVLLASAGVVSPTPVTGSSSELVERILRTNIAGSFYTVQAALPYLRSGASIVLIGSVVATMGVAGFGIYAASKAGISGMARALASELTPKGIRVNSLIPGPTHTPIWSTIAHSEPDLQELEKSLVRSIPIGRFNEVDEVARAALFLASENSSSMQAAEMVIDGGASNAPLGAPAYWG